MLKFVLFEKAPEQDYVEINPELVGALKSGNSHQLMDTTYIYTTAGTFRVFGNREDVKQQLVNGERK